MQTKEITYHVRLATKCEEGMGYVNYVFENLDFQDYDYQYFMCVKFPNWDSCEIEKGDVGYVTVKYVREGVDKWYDGKEFVTYKYTNIIFLKFIREYEKPVLNAIKID